MIEYEIHRAGYGKAYSEEDAIKLSFQSVMRECNVNEVDWTAFSKHIRISLINHHGGMRTIILYLNFYSDTDAVYFKMQHGDNLNSKLLPDQHLNAKDFVENAIKNVDVIVGDGQD